MRHRVVRYRQARRTHTQPRRRREERRLQLRLWLHAERVVVCAERELFLKVDVWRDPASELLVQAEPEAVLAQGRKHAVKVRERPLRGRCGAVRMRGFAARPHVVDERLRLRRQLVLSARCSGLLFLLLLLQLLRRRQRQRQCWRGFRHR